MALGLTIAVSPVVAAATNSFLKHYIKATWIKDIGRSFLWDILVLISKILDYVSEAIDVVLGQHLYQDFIAKYLPQSEIARVGIAIALVSVTFAGILLIINGDKMHLKDTVKSILIAVTLMASLASMNMINTMSDFQDKVIATTSITTEPDEEGTFHGFGDKLLAYSVYDNVATEKSGGSDSERTQKYLSDSNMSAEGIDINALASPYSEIGRKYDTSIEFDLQYKFSELDNEQMAELVGMSEEYETLNSAFIGDPYKEQEYWDYKSQTDKKGSKHKYEEEMIKQLANHPAVVAAGKTNDVLQAKTFVNALNRIKDTVIKDLNVEHNAEVYKDSTEIVTKKLRTALDYNKLHWYEQIGVDILEGKGEWESVYRYDFDFFATLVDLLIVTICCIFALLKLCRMLYEIAFMQILAPLIIASDAHGSGRAKRAVQQLINTFVVLIVVLITLRIYLIIVTQLHSSIDNLVARWGLILAGIYFVIDGSDFIVKMTGMDAGVKSGAAVLLGLRSAAGIAKGAAHTTASVATTGAHAANHIGGAAVGAAVGAGAGVAGGVAGGSDGRSSKGGRVVGGIIGGAAGSIDGAANGASEGARRGLTGLFRANSGGQGAGGSSGSGGSLTQSSAGGTAGTSSDISTSAASSDAGTTATPPPIMNTEASNGGDQGTDAPSSSSQADIGSSAANSDVETSAPVATPSANSPADSGTVATPNESAPTSEREGTVFTRSFEKGRQGGRAIAQPINTHRERKEAHPPLKERMSNRAADFFKGRYKDDDGNGGNS